MVTVTAEAAVCNASWIESSVVTAHSLGNGAFIRAPAAGKGADPTVGAICPEDAHGVAGATTTIVTDAVPSIVDAVHGRDAVAAAHVKGWDRRRRGRRRWSHEREG